MKEAKAAKDVKKAMTSVEPVAIFFYLPGCPHCENMEQPWKELDAEMKDVEFVTIKSDLAPPEVQGGGFPQFKLVKGGRIVAKADGEMSKEQLKRDLFGRGGRRRTRRLTRGRRKVAHRSTRVHVAFRK
jgi:thiol-disulfide isomerase/thioredoxin